MNSPQSHSIGPQHRRLWKTPAAITALLLAIPLLRSLFAGEWGWDIRVFLLVGAAATLLFSMGLTAQMIFRKVGSRAYRTAAVVAMVTVFLVVWGNFVQGADGVNPAAFGYFLAPMTGIVGAALGRFQPSGMARALFATALVQGLVLVIALILRDPQSTPWTAALARGFGGNAVDMAMFATSAFLFRKAAREESDR